MNQAFTTQAGAGLIAIVLKSGKIVHQSPSFQQLTSWVPVEAQGNIRVSLESRDGDDFHSFCQSVVKDVGEPNGETFLELDKAVGRSITVRFFTRAPGPPGLRNPEWLEKYNLNGITRLEITFPFDKLIGHHGQATQLDMTWTYTQMYKLLGDAHKLLEDCLVSCSIHDHLVGMDEMVDRSIALYFPDTYAFKYRKNLHTKNPDE